LANVSDDDRAGRPGLSDEPPRVLVIEDDASLREAVSSVLEAHGYTVRADADGRNARHRR
jgi:CheY-like chemotaxis protein